MCSAALANFFIQKAKEEDIELSNLKLQKLMYIGYGWTLALTGRDLTDGEGFQAWKHGPVSPTVYHQLKRYGSGAIQEKAFEFDEELGLYYPNVNSPENIQVLTKVWDIYKSFSAWSLRCLTHEDGTPWKAVFDPTGMYTEIPVSLVDQFYTNEIKGMLGSA
ncbi:Panacea domain-containing protein [Photobacterium sp. OFAV2-7]|uniref:Panacea domain-containing protein n=1 Tax=Photobacterium sp. OFAV2-7 TaxID=2917748 RepID=UPI001EF3E805|nr:type II toxin-antitoxin system antitoxin SocA domain-containing protein [Photobacterium sp. OFAV2-7]MCG7585648.1 DUF4065 domain-containing protein [Photobacterium sp. OFAV2-7]